jgi:hypothetical protein
MSHGASIYSHVYNPSISAEVPCRISRKQGWLPGKVANSALAELTFSDIETQPPEVVKISM